MFLEASRQLNLPPSGCVVFEDAPMGITAARAAGMRVVAMTTSFGAEQFAALAEPPDLACADFDAVLARVAWKDGCGGGVYQPAAWPSLRWSDPPR